MLLGTESQREEDSKAESHESHKTRALLARTVERNRFAIATFLIPLTIRAIPEIITGPYPIGRDVVAVVDYYSGRW